jgi:hypothetical protein
MESVIKEIQSKINECIQYDLVTLQESLSKIVNISALSNQVAHQNIFGEEPFIVGFDLRNQKDEEDEKQFLSLHAYRRY